MHFCTRSWGSLSLIALVLLVLQACQMESPYAVVERTERSPFVGLERFDGFVGHDARILWVAAHPDDETMAGPMLAYACLHRGNVCHIAVLTRGEGGQCGLTDGCKPDLGTVRAAEMQAAAKRLNAGLDIASFTNHKGDVAFDGANRQAIRKAWEAEGDPRGWLSQVMERFQPDLVMTLDPDHGFTGHVEHRIASKLVQEVLFPADGERPVSAHTADFHVLNRYAILEAIFGLDPAYPTEEWDPRRSCGAKTCPALAVDIAREHESQLAPSLGLMLVMVEKQPTVYLRQVRQP